MEVLVKILQFILSLSILVLVHEIGHFMMAKIFKTRVEKFYLFFDAWFSLFKFKKGDTEYGIGWLPLGGYVKISGMIDESLDTEQMKKPPQPWEFRSKPAWQRLLIMTGGVLFNFILAILIYMSVLYVWGETYLPTSNVKYGIVTDSAGYKMGLRNGDMIVSVDNQKVEKFYQVTSDIILNKRKSIQVDRNGEILSIDVSNDFVKAAIKGKGQIDARTPFGPFVIERFGKKSPAKAAGVEPGDILEGIDDLEFKWFDEYQRYLMQNAGKTVILNMIRDGRPVNFEVIPTQNGKLEVGRKYTEIFDYKTVSFGFFESFPAGIKKGITTIKDYLKQFRLLFSKDTKAYESLGGFITIGKIFPSVWNWEAFWNLTALLSVILAVMNILPIPALDGGHVMFLLFEVVTGRKPSDKFLEYAQIAGMVILISLLLFANGNDIIKLFKN